MLGVCCRWRPSGSLCSISYHHLGAIYERSEEEGGCDGLPSLETQPNCVDVTLKLGSAWWLAKSDRVHYVRFQSGDLKMLCWVYIVDGVLVGRCAASAATTWAPSMKEVKRKGGCV